MSQDLQNGVHQFRAQAHPSLAEHFATLAHGQSPDVLFIACADSRVVPSLITQAAPGELFVTRNAGNLVPPHGAQVDGAGVAATIEYAVKVLKVGEIVVCGHSDCGAVKAALDPESVAELPAIARWLAHVGLGDTTTTDLDTAIKANVLAQLDHLRTYQYIGDAAAAGKLTLHGWFYDIGSGRVETASDSVFSVL